MAMYRIFLRFYEELNDFLPVARRKVPFAHTLTRKASIKDVIESFGVPHTEVDLILVNQQSVDFAYIVRPDDAISVYPVFEAFDIAPLVRLRPKPLRETRFVLDVHLGRLAVYLRFLGYDTLYRNDYTDDELARISAEEKRILLTRDRGLLKRRMVTHGCYVRATTPKHQLAEVVHRLQLAPQSALSSRCTVCNSLLTAVAKDQVRHRLPPNTQRCYQDFSYCQGCDKVYWQGSHYHHLQKSFQEMFLSQKGNFTFLGVVVSKFMR